MIAVIAAIGTAGTLGWGSDAYALPCIEDRFGSSVNCTANDISITDISDIVVTDDGCTSHEDTVTFDAVLTVQTTATSRYNIGLFLGTDGVQAQNGECVVSDLPTSPVPPYVDLDGDGCGDSTSSAILMVPVTGATVECADANGDQQLDIVSCTSWQQNKAGTCDDAGDVVPGTASKCNCPATPTDIPIFVPDPVCTTNAECEALATGCNVGTCEVENPDAEAFGCVFTPTDSLCDDGAYCNGAETCDAGSCASGTPPDCDDSVECTVDTCDEQADTCVNAPNDAFCNDGQYCNGEETCSATSDCQAGTAPDCDDSVDCTVDTCDEQADTCVNTPDDAFCNDGQYCNGEETCSATSDCQAGAAPDCDDAVDCTGDTCDEQADTCVNTPDDTFCDDGLFCNGIEFCDAQADCTAGISPSCGDAVECSLDTCSEALGQCVSTPDDAFCDDADPCTFDLCSLEGGCENVNSCVEGICRSPGFWSAHSDLTLAVLAAVGGIETCGQSISTIAIGDLDSALEALCVDTEGVHVRTLYRQIVAALLNCAMSDVADCDAMIANKIGISIDACSALCAGEEDGEDAPTLMQCVERLDCYNNGGTIADGKCRKESGLCSITGDLCGGGYGECEAVDEVPQSCEPIPTCDVAEFCQEAIGVCPDTTGNGSEKLCRRALRSPCTIDDCN